MARFDDSPPWRSPQTRYTVGRQIRMAASILKLSPERVLLRAGLAADALEHEGKGFTAKQYYALWEALEAEAGRPELPLLLGTVAARGPIPPSVFAFSCSRDVESGLQRLKLFKPLVAPYAFTVGWRGDTLRITTASVDSEAPMPPRMAVFEAVIVVEMLRLFTAERIVPLSVAVPGVGADVPGLADYFGVGVAPAEPATIVLSAEDARRPLINFDPQLLAGMEQILARQLAEQRHDASITARVRKALTMLLPSGRASAEAVAAHLNLSTRSLHRHLRNEGQSFQVVLNATRTELSMQYLGNAVISIKEISYLLGFRDPNAFYRAFRSWTGMTPSEARARHTPLQ